MKRRRTKTTDDQNVEGGTNVGTSAEDMEESLLKSQPLISGDSGNGEKLHIRTDLVATPQKRGVVEDECAVAEFSWSDSSPLDKTIVSSLEKLGILTFYPMQVEVMKAIHSLPYSDICVQAPTGSGKTMAYAIPIVEALRGRVICRLRAVIVVPTRELASQVKSVFDALVASTSLKVGCVTGQSSFAGEQSFLVSSSGGSGVDILVATPGRLVDHLNGTPHFTLGYTRFLVIDESDRLLSQSFQNWLVLVEQATHHDFEDPDSGFFRDGSGVLKLSPTCVRYYVPTDSPGVPAQARMFSPPVQKLLFSATLMTNPEKIAALKLQNPVAISVSLNKYETPASLKEFYVVCGVGEKPLMLFYLFSLLGSRRMLVFTKGVESTHRLHRLIQLWGGVSSAEFSSLLPQKVRSRILEDFSSQSGSIRVLVSSDVMTRGIDISGISIVLNYDLPTRMRTYVHRAGRTARAGRDGSVYSLVRSEEMYHFKATFRKAQAWERLEKLSVEQAVLNPWIPRYEACLKSLGEVVANERRGDLSCLAAVEEILDLNELPTSDQGDAPIERADEFLESADA